MKQASIIPMFKFKGRGLPFKVQTINEFILNKEDPDEGPHSHDYYEMVWLTGGQGVLGLDMREYAIEGNMVFCLKPHEIHQFPIVPGMDGYIISFTESFFALGQYDFDLSCHASLYQIFSESRAIRIPEDMGAIMTDTALKMVREYEKLSVYSMDLLKRYFKIFMIYLMRTVEENLLGAEQSRDSELVANFMELLEKHFKEKKMVAQYADRLLVTPNYLNRTVKKITGFPAGHHIRQRVVKEAKRMGRYSDAGMKEIAYDLGFLDSAHFSRFLNPLGASIFQILKREGRPYRLGPGLRPEYEGRIFLRRPSTAKPISSGVGRGY